MNYSLFASVAIFTASGHNTIQFIFMSYIYINWKQLTFLSTTKVFELFFPLSHLNVILSQLSRAQTVLLLIENIRDIRILWLFLSSFILYPSEAFEKQSSGKKLKVLKKSSPKTISLIIARRNNIFCVYIWIVKFSCVQKSTACTFLQQLSKKVRWKLT